MQHWIYNRIRFLCCIQGRMMPYIVMIWIFQRAATVRKKKDIPSWINQSSSSSSKQKSFPNIEKKCDVNHLPAVVTMLIIETTKLILRQYEEYDFQIRLSVHRIWIGKRNQRGNTATTFFWNVNSYVYKQILLGIFPMKNNC